MFSFKKIKNRKITPDAESPIILISNSHNHFACLNGTTPDEKGKDDFLYMQVKQRSYLISCSLPHFLLENFRVSAFVSTYF